MSLKKDSLNVRVFKVVCKLRKCMTNVKTGTKPTTDREQEFTRSNGETGSNLNMRPATQTSHDKITLLYIITSIN